MSFLKKHWRFTVPAVIVLCVLLLGVFTLYTNNKPPEPKTVYGMPERSPDNPPVYQHRRHITSERLSVVSARRIIKKRANAAAIEGFISETLAACQYGGLPRTVRSYARRYAGSG